VNVDSGDEWNGGGTSDFVVNEPTCIHICNIFIGIKM
jgi:hypothetical protein